MIFSNIYKKSAKKSDWQIEIFIKKRGFFMEKKYNVDSFNLDHTKVKAPFVRHEYLRTE